LLATRSPRVDQTPVYICVDVQDDPLSRVPRRSTARVRVHKHQRRRRWSVGTDVFDESLQVGQVHGIKVGGTGVPQCCCRRVLVLISRCLETTSGQPWSSSSKMFFFLHRWSCSQAQTVSSSWISNLKNQIDCYLGGVFSGVVASGFGLAERSWFFTFARSSLHQMVRDLKVSSCTRARRSVRLIASRWSRPTGSNGYFIDSITSVRWAL